MTLAVFRRGRPTRAGIRSSSRCQFVLTPSEADSLKQVAKDNSQTISEMVRLAVNTYVADYREGIFLRKK